MVGALAFCLSLAASSLPPAEPPRAVVRHAISAVEGDSVAGVRRRWERAAIGRTPDRSAILGLATLARLTYSYATADSLFAKLTAVSAPDDISVYALLGSAQSARNRGAMRDAEAFATAAAAAARAIGDSVAHTDALILLGATRARTAGPRAADSVLQQLASLTLEDAQAAQLHCARAEMLALSFRPAMTEAVAGLEKARRAGDARLQAQCLHLMAADTARRGWIPASVKLFGEAAAMRRRLHDRIGLASSLQWRGAQLRVLGFVDESWRDFQEAVAEGRASGNKSAMAWSFAGLMSIEGQLGDAVSSAAYSDSASALFAQQGDLYGQALALEGKAAQSFLVGDLTRAADAYAKSAALYENLGFGQGAYTARMGLVSLRLTQRDLDAAERELRGAEATARKYNQGAYVNSIIYYYGLIALRRGQYAVAEKAFATQLAKVQAKSERAPDRAQPNWEYYDQMRLAEVYARRGEVSRAGMMAMQASESLDRWRAKMSHKELRLLALQMTEIYNDNDMGLSTVVATLAAAQRPAFVDTAFAVVERLHARELLDRLVRADGLRAAAASSTAREQNDTTALRPTLARALSTAEIAAALPDDSTALLQYLVGRNGAPGTVFALTRASLRAATLPGVTDSIAPQIERFSSLIESGATPRELARALADRVLDPALALIPAGTRRLLIVPDGALHRLPFDALVTADGKFAIERFTIATLPSGSIAARLRRQAPSAQPVRVLAIGDPALGNRSRGTVVQQSAMVGGARAQAAALQDLPRLPASIGEAKAVARYGDGSVTLIGRAASEARLKKLPLSSFRVLHFATHARADEATLSGTALALAPGDGEDGLLGPGELSRFSLDADLVTLSACRSGGGAVVRGEGIVGLAAPLIEAGARDVALTRWPIGDRSTTAFVADFYASLATGAPIGDALRSAKLSAMQRGAPPAQWAAFAIVGDPMIRIPLVRSARWTASQYLWLGVGILACLVAIRLLRKTAKA